MVTSLIGVWPKMKQPWHRIKRTSAVPVQNMAVRTCSVRLLCLRYFCLQLSREPLIQTSHSTLRFLWSWSIHTCHDGVVSPSSARVYTSFVCERRLESHFFWLYMEISASEFCGKANFWATCDPVLSLQDKGVQITTHKNTFFYFLLVVLSYHAIVLAYTTFTHFTHWAQIF